MTVAAELSRARALAFAGDSGAARDLLLSLVSAIERADRDDQLLEVFSQLAEIYLVRSAFDGTRECVGRIRAALQIYDSIRAGRNPEAAAQVTLSAEQVDLMCERYRHRALGLEAALAAASGRHDDAATVLTLLDRAGPSEALAAEHRRVLTTARVRCALGLCDDELHARAAPLWVQVHTVLVDAERTGGAGLEPDRLYVEAGLGYGRFCVETGRYGDAEPWLRRAGARAQARGWRLEAARAEVELAASRWATGDVDAAEGLIAGAYPVIAEYARAHDVGRCWLYLGLIALATGALERADECWAHAERCWHDLARPIHLYRILLQRSWIPIFCGRWSEAEALIARARAHLDAAACAGWLQYARLDDQLGNLHRARGLAELGFDAAGNPEASWEELEFRHVASLGIVDADPDAGQRRRALYALAKAAELKIPAALAVDSVRYSITDAQCRSAWAAGVSAPALAGAFAVAWEAENTPLVAELIEYHCARGAFAEPEPAGGPTAGWASTATAPIPVDDGEHSLVAAAPSPSGTQADLLAPLPPLRMDPGAEPVLALYRELAHRRYGRGGDRGAEAWPTWP